MKFFLLINVKMPTITIVGILTFMNRKNSILGLSEPEKKLNYLIITSIKISCSAKLCMKISYNLRAWFNGILVVYN